MPSPAVIKSQVSTQTRAPVLMGFVDTILAVAISSFNASGFTIATVLRISSGSEVFSRYTVGSQLKRFYCDFCFLGVGDFGDEFAFALYSGDEVLQRDDAPIGATDN